MRKVLRVIVVVVHVDDNLCVNVAHSLSARLMSRRGRSAEGRRKSIWMNSELLNEWELRNSKLFLSASFRLARYIFVIPSSPPSSPASHDKIHQFRVWVDFESVDEGDFILLDTFLSWWRREEEKTASTQSLCAGVSRAVLMWFGMAIGSETIYILNIKSKLFCCQL